MRTGLAWTNTLWRAALPILGLAMLSAGSAGCLGPGGTALAGPERPPGFTIGVRVRPPQPETPAGGGGAASAPPGTTAPSSTTSPPVQRALRPARYLIETDGRLRVATPPVLGTPVARFPPQVRALSPRQMDRLWLLAREARLFDHTHPGRLTTYGPPRPDPAMTSVVFEVSTDHRPHMVVVLLESGTPEAAAARQLIDQLAELAWIPEG